MNYLKKLLLFMCIATGSIYAQETVAAAGGDITGTGGSVSYTLGQLVYTTIEGGDGTVSQGVQQPFEISQTLSVDGFTIDLTMVAYPNPTIDNLRLKIKNFNNEDLSYQLYDVLGRAIDTNKIKNNTTTIQMSRLPNAIYFLRVSAQNKEIKVFRIVKRQL